MLSWFSNVFVTRSAVVHTNPKDILPLIQDYLNKVANQETVNAINFAIEIQKGDK